MSFKDVTEFCQAEAIANKLFPTEESVWRIICREYSTKFHTPLHLVKQMDPEEVALEVYESQLDKADAEENIENLLDVIYGLEDPEYEKERREELDKFIEDAEAQEEDRLEKGKPIHPGMKKEFSLANLPEPAPVTEAKKSGFIDMSYLENSKDER